MKTTPIWISISTAGRKRSWKWKPWFSKSHIVYEQGDRSFLSPMWEFGWGCFVFHYTAYHIKQLYKTGITEPHECSADVKQERINELEIAIRAHQKFWSGADMHKNEVDKELWSVLRDQDEESNHV